MLIEPTDLLAENPDWIRVLAAYAEAEQQLAAAQKQQSKQAPEATVGAAEALDADETLDAEEDDEEGATPSQKWLPRVRHVEHVALAQLPAIHGKLIAHGLLKFDLQGRNDGVVYRLTQQSRSAVKHVKLEELPISLPPGIEAESESAVDQQSETVEAA